MQFDVQGVQTNCEHFIIFYAVQNWQLQSKLVIKMGERLEAVEEFSRNNILLDTQYTNNKLKNIHVAAASTMASRTFFKREIRFFIHF